MSDRIHSLLGVVGVLGVLGLAQPLRAQTVALPLQSHDQTSPAQVVDPDANAPAPTHRLFPINGLSTGGPPTVPPLRKFCSKAGNVLWE